ncbi:MAG: head-tail connector protein, partial [bacterium]
MQIDSNPLTTLAKLKTWLGITTVADDAVLQWSIEAASRAVQTYCGRNFTETRYY